MRFLLCPQLTFIFCCFQPAVSPQNTITIERSNIVAPWRTMHAAAIVNDLMVVFGGLLDSTTGINGQTNELFVYNSSSGSWFQPATGNAPKKKPAFLKALSFQDEVVIYAPDGQGSKNPLLVLDTALWSWTNPLLSGSAVADRVGCTFAKSGDAAILHGGVLLDNSGKVNRGALQNDLNILNVNAKSWTPAANGPARQFHTSCYMSSRSSFIMFGGVDQNFQVFNDVLVYDLKGKTWNVAPKVDNLGGAPAARAWHSAVCLNNTMIVFGGGTISPDGKAIPIDNEVWLLVDTGTHLTWTRPSVLNKDLGPTARVGHTSVLRDDGKMLVYGGYGGEGDSSVYFLDTNNWEWKRFQPKTVKIERISASPTSSLLMVIVGVAMAVFGIVSVGIIGVISMKNFNARKRNINGRIQQKELIYAEAEKTYQFSFLPEDEMMEERALLPESNERLDTAESYRGELLGLTSFSNYHNQAIMQAENQNFLSLPTTPGSRNGKKRLVGECLSPLEKITQRWSLLQPNETIDNQDVWLHESNSREGLKGCVVDGIKIGVLLFDRYEVKEMSFFLQDFQYVIAADREEKGSLVGIKIFDDKKKWENENAALRCLKSQYVVDLKALYALSHQNRCLFLIVTNCFALPRFMKDSNWTTAKCIIECVAWTHSRGFVINNLSLTSFYQNRYTQQLQLGSLSAIAGAGDMCQVYDLFNNFISPEMAYAIQYADGLLMAHYATDIWSLGCIIYELFTGKKLFSTSIEKDGLIRFLCNPNSQYDLNSLEWDENGVLIIKDQIPALINQLLGKMLVHSKESRISATDALRIFD